MDAALAAAATLTVAEPTENGLGGDAFALVWHTGSPRPERVGPLALRGGELRVAETGPRS